MGLKLDIDDIFQMVEVVESILGLHKLLNFEPLLLVKVSNAFKQSLVVGFLQPIKFFTKSVSLFYFQWGSYLVDVLLDRFKLSNSGWSFNKLLTLIL